MKGQLNEQPLVELIREISAKSLGGRLRLEHERVKVVAYFENGNFLYAASNLRTLRLTEYLKKHNLVSEQDLAQFNDRVSDNDVIKILSERNLLSRSAAEQVQALQVADVLRRALLWTEGTWEFDARSRLNEQLDLKIDTDSLLLDAARRLPASFVKSRFVNPAELISPAETPPVHANLSPTEGFLLSRLDRPTTIKELVAISGVGEAETLGLIYSLTLAGVLKREHWHRAFRDPTPTQLPEPEKKPEPAPEQQTRDSEVDENDVESFLERLKGAQTFYEVLSVSPEVSPQDLKAIYYRLARRYHPDRFRKSEPMFVSRLESAFARITQAYDTLRDDRLRTNYNSKLQARKKAEQLADSAPKATTAQQQPESVAEGSAEPLVPVAERAETQFKEGFAALELGERKVALGLFAAAARAVPNEARYRAFHGQMLAANEATRRAAETELLAAIKLDPQKAEYRVMLAELYRDLGLKLRAKGETERALAVDPNNKKARDLLRALE